MSSGFSLVTFVTTVLAGVCVFIIGQFILKFIFDPISQLKLEIADIAHKMVFYANRYSNPVVISKENIENEEMKADMIEVSMELRTSASRLSSKVQAVPFYNFFAFFRIVPKLYDLNKVQSNIIGLSNSLWIGKDHDYKIYEKIEERRNEIKHYLKIRL
ncbi:hypothetical protein E3U55_14360 [Filobacillus milosensis]|uniref:Uncharacterized protein n=1 Tax=Filobacillus milosensis TaxID=94137 RepID=A0A4Y8IG25_9BACI|nr:hypothetical protein [Filobacillus milosensis]TFB14097.1 hypothetical protein E3U55_14360 [Filobacillus milosensis]